MGACVVSAIMASALAVGAAFDFTGLGTLILACASAYASILAARRSGQGNRKVDTVTAKVDAQAKKVDAVVATVAETVGKVQETHDLVNGQGKILQAVAYATGQRDKLAEQKGTQQEGLPGIPLPPPAVAAPDDAPEASPKRSHHKKDPA